MSFWVAIESQDTSAEMAWPRPDHTAAIYANAVGAKEKNMVRRMWG